MERYPLNNCLATVKSKVVRETDRWKWASEEKQEHHHSNDLFHTRPLRQHSSPMAMVPSSPEALLKGMKQHLRSQYDLFGGNEAYWDDLVVRHVSGVMRAIGEVYYQHENKLEALLYLRASWELKRTAKTKFPDTQVMNNLMRIAELHKLLGEPKMAKLAYVEVLPLAERLYGPDHHETAKVYSLMMKTFWQRFDWREPYSPFK